MRSPGTESRRPDETTAVKLDVTLTVDRGVTDVVGEDDISG